MGRRKIYLFGDVLADIIEGEPTKPNIKPYKENEALRNAQKRYYEKNKQRKNELHKEYYQNNREKLNAYMREYNKKKKAQTNDTKNDNVEAIDPIDNIDT